MPCEAKATVLKKKKKRVRKALPGMDQVMQSRSAKKKSKYVFDLTGEYNGARPPTMSLQL